jgi:hypothetical protein
LIQEEIKRRLNSGNILYHPVQNLSFSRPLSKTVKIGIYRPITLLVVLFGYENWSLILREECRLKVFENRILRRMFGPNEDEVTGSGRR